MRPALTSCLIIAVLHCVLTASATTVGLYAPDRYDGIPEMCLKPMDFGYCRAKVKRYYFDMRRMKCAMFYFGGCAGNVNNFKSLEECNKVCLDGYGDYDGPNDVPVSSSRDYSRGRSSATVDSAAGSSSNSSGGNTSGSRGSTNATVTNNNSGGSSTGYKNTYSKYNGNYGANISNKSSNSNNNSSAIQNRSDGNVDDYNYEEK